MIRQSMFTLVVLVMVCSAAPAQEDTPSPEPRVTEPTTDEIADTIEPTPLEDELTAEPSVQESTDDATTIAPTPAGDAPSAEEVMRQMLERRQDPPPTPPTPQRAAPNVPEPPTATVAVDPAVIGIAPGEDPPPLKREGSFIVSRRGRMVQSLDGGSRLFVFEADSLDAPEAPMILQPCRLLETMEDLVRERGDHVVFTVSGQVHNYRGANYLLPTMMIIEPDRGNLEN
jgi:hypothetical protein